MSTYRNGAYIKSGVFLLFTLKFSVLGEMTMDLKFDMILDGNVFLKLYGASFMKCQDNCAIRPRCKSINYRRLSMECQLNIVTAATESSLTEQSGWVYYDRSEWNTETICGTCSNSHVCNTGINTCEVRECEDLQGTGAFRVFGNTNHVNSRKVLACPDDKYPMFPETFVSWPVQSNCLANGTWSTSYLNCTDYTTACHNYLTNSTSMQWSRYKLQDVQLVSGPCGVADNMLSASSWHKNDVSYDPSNAKFNKTGSWVADPSTSDPSPYLQVQFDYVLEIKGIQTKGRGSASQWVTTFNVTYSTSYCSQNPLESQALNSTGSTTFIGNIDENSTVINTFQTPINASCVRVHPLTKHSGPNVDYPAMQFDLIGTVKLPVF